MHLPKGEVTENYIVVIRAARLISKCSFKEIDLDKWKSIDSAI